jgi:CTP synthase (UTP-ammonia lyase)
MSNQARAVVDVIDALESANVGKEAARKAAMSLADYIAELQRNNGEHIAERFNAINARIDERFKVNEERIKTMFWKGTLFLTIVILLTNPGALTLMSKLLRLS